MVVCVRFAGRGYSAVPVTQLTELALQPIRCTGLTDCLFNLWASGTKVIQLGSVYISVSECRRCGPVSPDQYAVTLCTPVPNI